MIRLLLHLSFAQQRSHHKQPTPRLFSLTVGSDTVEPRPPLSSRSGAVSNGDLRKKRKKSTRPKDKEPRRRRRTTSIIQMPCYRRCKQNGRAEEGEVCNPIRLPSVTKSKGKGGEEMKLLDATERRYERRRGNYTPDRRNRIVSRIWTTEGKREDSVRRYVPHNKAVGS